MNKPLISIVSPVYHGEKMVAELVRRNKANRPIMPNDGELRP